jgi:hypothetical protein
MTEEVVEAEVIEVDEEVERLPAVRAHAAVVARDEITVDELLAQRDKIVQAMERAMKPEVHYGHIPGIPKPTLLKPGAELLNVLFRFAPSYHSERTWHDDGHLTVVSRCTLTHIPSDYVIAEGEGLCSSREAKYAYRQSGRVCPECGKDAIIKGKAEFGGGWLCFKKKGGCGAKWSDDSEEGQAFATAEVGRVPNEEIADTYNTVLKMANKRSLIAAILNGTAASDVFTQDVEDQPAAAAAAEPEPQPESQEFDPGKHLLDGAIPLRGDATVNQLAEQMKHLEPTLDWGAVIKQAWPGERTPEFWRRLSNTLQWINRRGGGGDFPPASTSEIIDGFAWGFSGSVVELVWKKSDAALSAEEQAQMDEGGE